MKEKIRLLIGILLFGSLWGFSEVVIGNALRDANLPAGSIMTGVFALGLLLLSRLLFKTRGMQFGMGAVAGILRLFNPFGSCHICSAIAIMAEGLLFELIWAGLSIEDEQSPTAIVKVSAGVITSYGIYVLGYIVTQIMTPLLSSAGFHIQNLLPFIPQILSSGLLAAVIGGAAAPVVWLLKDLELKKVKDSLYYSASILISAICWVAVIV